MQHTYIFNIVMIRKEREGRNERVKKTLILNKIIEF
jgi:hypothetical protein